MASAYTDITANGIPIEGWINDPHDEALLDLLPVLDSLRFTSDVLPTYSRTTLQQNYQGRRIHQHLRQAVQRHMPIYTYRQATLSTLRTMGISTLWRLLRTSTTPE